MLHETAAGARGFGVNGGTARVIRRVSKKKPATPS